MIYLFITVGVMVLDRFVKTAVDKGMQPGDTIPVLEDFFHLTYVRNTGAAFSLLQGHPMLLVIVPGIVILIALVYMIANSKTMKRTFLFALALICGGGLGNLTDRIAYGYVIDMFDFRFFPVFNIADIAVVVGCGLLIIYLIVYENRNPKK
ncbi:MAG: signal peptidase II [Eubacteriales bacterium]|nr:signal peptidase II [Eubacteriales bacterium]